MERVLELQVVCVSWGRKYPPEIVNRLCQTVRERCSRSVRFVCISDRPRTDYAAGVDVLPFPLFGPAFPADGAGYLLKMSVFAQGLLEPRASTLYLDLDTVVRGDVALLADELERHGGLLMLRGHLLPTWRLRWPLRPGGYYFGNSSVMAFRPIEFADLPQLFDTSLAARAAGHSVPQLRTFDRFLSHAVRGRMRVFPSSLAVKFAQEYVSIWPALQDLEAMLPWVRRRRSGQVAVSFVGAAFKPECLAEVEPGDLLRHKRRTVRWATPEFSAYFREALRADLPAEAAPEE